MDPPSPAGCRFASIAGSLTAERLLTFAKELNAQLPSDTREEMLQALREILLNAMEHGAAFNL